MKLKVQKIRLLSLILVVYVNSVHGQFAKGVVQNNVFTHYINKTSGGGSSDHLNINQDTTNIGYFRSKLNPIMTPALPYNTLAAIKPTTNLPRPNYRLKKPESSPWNATAKPVIAYTLPPNMKLKLENAVRHGHLGSRSRSTKKMNSATTPQYEPTEMNGIIIKNFINHLSTTKSNIESNIPNPNQFYTTPSSEGGDIEPLVIMNSNTFFPVNNYNSNGGNKNEEQDDEGPPIIISGSTNINSFPAQYQNSIKNPNMVTTQPPPSFPKYTQTSPLPVISTVLPKIPQNPTLNSVNHQQKIRVPSRKGSQPISRPLKPPVRRRPTAQSQHNKRQSVKVSTTITPQLNLSQSVKVQKPNKSPLENVPNVMYPQQNNPSNSAPQGPSSMQLTSHNLPYESIKSPHHNPVILDPTRENSVNIFNSISPQQLAGPTHSITSNSINALNPAMSQYPTNQAMSQQTQFFNSIPSIQTQIGQQLGPFNQTLHQSVLPLPMTHDRPNNSLKQLQLQFLLDCSLLDPQTKTRIPLGTNPVGDDFFFTPMPYTNQNPSFAPINIKQIPQIPFNPFNPQSYLPSFPSLFPTTPPPLTAVVLTDTTTQTTQQPIYVSIQPTQNSHRRKQKKKVKNVYVDLPIVSEVGNMLDRVYNFMEESLVTKVVKKTETQPARRVQATAQTQVPQIVQVIPSNQIVPLSAIGGSSEEDYLQRYTTPYYRTTRSRRHRPKKRRPMASTYYTNRLPSNNWQPISFHRQKRTTLAIPNYKKKEDQNKNYLTTKIHVTSEYSGPHPTEILDYEDKKKVPESSEEDDYYYDSFTFPELNLDSGSDDDDDDDDDDDIDDDEEDDIDNVKKNVDSASAQENSSSSKKQIKKKNRKNSKQTSAGSLENDSYEDDDDDDGGGGGGGSYFTPSMGMFQDFFGNVVSSVNKYVPKFGGYMPSLGNYFRGGSGSKEMDYNSIDREERSTTPKIETRNPKNPKYIFSDYNDYNGIDSPDGNVGGPWYNPYFGSNEATTSTPDITPASNDYWNWFGNSNENIESATESSATNQNSSGNYSFNSSWFFGLFGNDESKPETTTTTTTKKPFLTVDNPMYKPHNWLGILANHLVVNKPPNYTTPAVPQKVSYDNYQLWRLMPESEDQVTFLEDYRTTPEGAKLQWWKGPTLRGPTDIAIPPNAITDVKTSLDYEEIPHEVVIWDLEKAIKFENPPMSRREKLEMEITQEHPMSWYRYHRYSDIVKFLEYLQRKYPSSVELIHIGRTFEGRPLIVAKVSAPNSDNWKGRITASEKKKKKANKRSIFIESGTHAREWITPAVATWILDKLVQGINNSDALGETIRSVDWYVMPVLNPDGYEYSHQFDRLWRKTRSKHKEEPSLLSNALNWLRKDQKDKEKGCYGTDLNRNWNHNWNEKGSSKSDCSEFYAGPKAFSEPEIRALSKFLEEQKKNIKIYLSLHSYGQIISYPSRANASYNSIKSDDLFDMAQVALETLRGSGSSTRYIVDNTNEMMYARSGSSDLYAMYDLGIKYSYAMELRDSGTHGFLLPPSNIDSTAKETFEIIKGMVDYI